MRNRFAEELTKIVNENDDIVLLYGDIGNRLFDLFKKSFPNRSFNCGVAEQNMVGVAAGLAKTGFTPIVYTINTFLYLRAFEQIKLDVCYPQVPVIMVGTGSGLSYSELGTTHHSLEDLGVLRQFPNLHIFAPSSPNELAEVLRFAYASKAPSYIRIGKKGEGELAKLESVLETPNYFGPFFSSRSEESEIVMISCGTISENVSKACKILRVSGIKVDHITQPQIAPLNIEALSRIVHKYRSVITIEEHNSVGALSAIYSDLIAKLEFRPNFTSISTPSLFHVGLGNLEEAREHLGLDPNSLANQVTALVKK
jgi:transketolase